MGLNAEFLREIRAESQWGIREIENALTTLDAESGVNVSGVFLEREEAEKLLNTLREATQKRKVCTMQMVLDHSSIPYALCLKSKEWGKLLEMIKRLHGDLYISTK